MKFTSKVVAVLATAALTTGGLAATTSSATGAAPKQPAASSAKGFNFISSAYGTRVFNKNNDLVDSGRTAWSFIGCTSKTGKTNTDHLAKVELPGDQLKVGPITTESKSVKSGGSVKSQATTKVGDIELKSSGIGSLKIEGLTGTSESSNKDGEFDQKGSVSLLGIKAVLGGIEVSLPFDPDNIKPGQELKLPGLAKLRFLNTRGKATDDYSLNNSVALEIKVLTPGPLEGQTVRVGSARTRLEAVSPKGKVHGYGEAAHAELLNGVVSSGRVAYQPLKCGGTDGEWHRNNVAGVHAGPIRIGAATGQVRGISEAGKNPLAHTKARIAGVKLTNSLKIGAIESSAKVEELGNGKFKKSSDMSVLRVTAAGDNWTKELNKAIKNSKPLRIPGIAKITPNVVKETKRSVSVTALKITLLDVAKPLKSTIWLANTEAKISG